jgi:hypothetical protein
MKLQPRREPQELQRIANVHAVVSLRSSTTALATETAGSSIS